MFYGNDGVGYVHLFEPNNQRNYKKSSKLIASLATRVMDGNGEPMPGLFQYDWANMAQLCQRIDIGCFEDWELNVHEFGANEEAALQLVPAGNEKTQIRIQMFRPDKRFSVDPNDKQNAVYCSDWSLLFTRPIGQDNDANINCAYLSCNNTEVPLNHESEVGAHVDPGRKYSIWFESQTVYKEPCAIREPHKVIVYQEPGARVAVRRIAAQFSAAFQEPFSFGGFQPLPASPQHNRDDVLLQALREQHSYLSDYQMQVIMDDREQLRIYLPMYFM